MKQFAIHLLVILTYLSSFASGQDLKYSEKSKPDLYDPVYGGISFEEERINELLHTGLYGTDRLGSSQYKLAAAFPIYSSNGKEMEIKLREDIKWSDGKVVTAEDFIYSWRLLKTMDYSGKNLLKEIKSISKDPNDDHKLIINLDVKNEDNSYHRTLDFPLVPEHIVGGMSYSQHDEYAENPVNVGRYKISSIKGNILELESLYWPHSPQTIDHVRTIQIMFFPAVDQIYRYFSTRSTNFILDIPGNNMSEILSRPQEYGTRDYAANKWSGVAFNNKNDFLENDEARLALTMLFDRERTIKNRYFGKASLITGPFTNGSSFYDETIPPHPFSPEKSKALLEKLGCTWNRDKKILYNGDPVILRIITNTSKLSSNDDVALNSFRTNIENLGFILEQNSISNEKIFIDKLENKRDEYDMAYITLKYPGDLGVMDVFHSDGDLNVAQYDDAITDDLMEQLERATNNKVRIDLGKKIHRRIHEKTPFIFLWAHNYTAGYNVNQIDNIDIDPMTIFNSVTTWKAIQ